MEENPIKDADGKIAFVERRVLFHLSVIYSQKYTAVHCDICKAIVFHSDTVKLAPEEIIKQAFINHAH